MLRHAPQVHANALRTCRRLAGCASRNSSNLNLPCASKYRWYRPKMEIKNVKNASEMAALAEPTSLRDSAKTVCRTDARERNVRERAAGPQRTDRRHTAYARRLDPTARLGALAALGQILANVALEPARERRREQLQVFLPVARARVNIHHDHLPSMPASRMRRCGPGQTSRWRRARACAMWPTSLMDADARSSSAVCERSTPMT